MYALMCIRSMIGETIFIIFFSSVNHNIGKRLYCSKNLKNLGKCLEYLVWLICKYSRQSFTIVLILLNNSLRVFISKYVCMYVCVCVYVCMYVCMYVSMYVCMYNVCVCVCVCMYVCMCIYIYIPIVWVY